MRVFCLGLARPRMDADSRDLVHTDGFYREQDYDNSFAFISRSTIYT